MTQRYALIGAGGTGTHLLDPLVRYLTNKDGTDANVWQLGVIDGDVVEEKNLSRQLFSEMDVAVNKANAATVPYQHLRNVIAIPEYLGVDNIARYLTDGVVVLIAVDNFPVRALIEEHCSTLDNVVVINGGNEHHTGSCQIWIRENGVDVTPRLSFLHPEILQPGENRATMSCAQVAALPGGEQLIATNMASAMWMLSALWNVHNIEVIPWTELQFDIEKGTADASDLRSLKGWANE